MIKDQIGENLLKLTDDKALFLIDVSDLPADSNRDKKMQEIASKYLPLVTIAFQTSLHNRSVLLPTHMVDMSP